MKFSATTKRHKGKDRSTNMYWIKTQKSTQIPILLVNLGWQVGEGLPHSNSLKLGTLMAQYYKVQCFYHSSDSELYLHVSVLLISNSLFEILCLLKGP